MDCRIETLLLENIANRTLLAIPSNIVPGL